MKEIYSFLSKHKHLITWTVGYVFVLWALLKFLFNFSIFNAAQWHRLIHAELHGFAGFVFGIMILAAGPLYIATSALIIKQNKPLFEIPIPKWIKNIKIPTTKTQPEKTTPAPTTEQKTADKKTEETLSDEIPLEIRNAFARAKLHPIKFTKPENKEPAPDTNSTATEVLPLPTDFDIQLDEAFDESPISIPTFSDINFDEEDDDTDEVKNTNDSEITITNTHAIVTHSDPDFWVVDDDNWFATGKTRPSPIAAVLKAAHEHNVKPVIHLAQSNILDIENLIKKWESDGITVITDLSEL